MRISARAPGKLEMVFSFGNLQPGAIRTIHGKKSIIVQGGASEFEIPR
jgi:hypothetical protein